MRLVARVISSRLVKWLLLVSAAACSDSHTDVVRDAGAPIGGRADAGGVAADAASGNGAAGQGTAGLGGGGLGGAGEGGAASDAGTVACDLACAAGAHCELMPVQCVRAPCPPQPTCIDDADGGDVGVDCDPSKIVCKQARPQCAPGTAPSVSGDCYGPCVNVSSCICSQDSQCPQSYEFLQCIGHCIPSYI